MPKILGIEFSTPKRLTERGILSLNQRNAEFILPNNNRKYYNQVDSKFHTKQICQQGGIPTPELYSIVKNNSNINRTLEFLKYKEAFAIKPDRGSGGKGILIITGKQNDQFIKPSGNTISYEAIQFHITNILGGLFSLGGRRDMALIEYCIQTDPQLNTLSYSGAPDIRIILYKGYIVMAMLRAATRESDGKANLHMGGLGLGLSLTNGETTHAIHLEKPVTHHPDSKNNLIGVTVPHWEKILKMSLQASELTNIVYLGVDLMLDQKKGPLLIEMNARPGLAIQLANNQGLVPRLKQIDAHLKTHPRENAEERLAFSLKNFSL